MDRGFETPRPETAEKIQELSAFEIWLKYRTLTGLEKEQFVEKAKKAGFDFESIIDWATRDPELSLGQLLEKAGIDPEAKFRLEE